MAGARDFRDRRKVEKVIRAQGNKAHVVNGKGDHVKVTNVVNGQHATYYYKREISIGVSAMLYKTFLRWGWIGGLVLLVVVVFSWWT
jgi:hypothetical protein